jgi:hypothetical protein
MAINCTDDFDFIFLSFNAFTDWGPCSARRPRVESHEAWCKCLNFS